MIDTFLIQQMLEGALDAAADLHGIDIEGLDKINTNKTYVAGINRELLELADQIQLVSCMVRTEYWKSRSARPVKETA